MKLKRTSIFMQLYLTANKRYPKDFCSLFWGCLWAFVLLPLSIIGIPFMLAKKDVRRRGLTEKEGSCTVGRGAWTLVALMMIVDIAAFFLQEGSLLRALLVTIIYVVGFFVLALAVGFIIHLLTHGIKRLKTRINEGGKENKPTVVSEWIRDYKGKHCSMLTVEE